MKFDRYDTYARLIPAIISLAPLLILNHYFLSTLYQSLFTEVRSIKLVGGLSLTGCFLYPAFYFGRFSGSLIEEWLFQGGLIFPTTLAFDPQVSKFSVDYRKRLKQKIANVFGVILPKNLDAREDRLIVNETVGFIRRRLRRNEMVLQRNIHYGFIKNLTGSVLLFSLPISAVNISLSIIQDNHTALLASSIILLGCLVLLIAARSIITYIGHQYAVTLFDEFMDS